MSTLEPPVDDDEPVGPGQTQQTPTSLYIIIADRNKTAVINSTLLCEFGFSDLHPSQDSSGHGRVVHNFYLFPAKIVPGIGLAV